MSDPDADCDGDGLTNAEEASLGTNPLVGDTDGDGLTDGTEVHVHFTQPDEADTDDGGTDDGTEVELGTDPNDPNDDPLSQSLGDGPTATQSTATRQVSIPAGTAVVDLQVEVAGSTGANGSARVVVEGDSSDQTVFEVVDGEQQSGQVTADLSSFAGETVTLRLATEGEAQLAVESLKLAFDTDGDGLTDPIERHGLRTGSGELLRTVVSKADTDGDGLEDGAEVTRVDAVDSSAPGGYYVLHSDPTRFDSDRDGVDDFDERRVWNSFPFTPDTDGDGYTDLVDQDVDTDSAPPSLRFRSRIDDFSRQVTVLVTDSSDIESVTVNARYPLGTLNSRNVEDSFVHRQIMPRNRERINATTVAYKVPIPRGGALSTRPLAYYVNVTDVAGNTMSVLVMLNGSQNVDAFVAGASVESDGEESGAPGAGAAATVTVAGSTFSLSGPQAILVIAAVALLGDAIVRSKQLSVRFLVEGTEVNTETLKGGRYEHVPPTGEEVLTEFPAPFSEEPTLKLPRGTIYDAPPLNDGSSRRWGWEQIKRFPGIGSRDDLGEILETPRPVGEYGPYTVVVGNNPNGPGQIGLLLLGSTLVGVAASANGYQNHQITITEDRVRHILEKDNWGHNILGDNEAEVLRNLIRIISNPDEVWKAPGEDVWMYVARLTIEGEEVIVVLFVEHGVLKTAYAPSHPETEGPAGHTIEYIKYHIKQQQFMKVAENSDNPVVPEVPTGEVPPDPGPRPDPK